MSKTSLWREKGFCFMLLIVWSKLKYSVINLFRRTYARFLNTRFLKKQMARLNVEWNVRRVWPLLSSWNYLKGVMLEVHWCIGNEPGVCYAFLLPPYLLPQGQTIPKCFSKVTTDFHSYSYQPGPGHHASSCLQPCLGLSSGVLVNQLSKKNNKTQNPHLWCLPISNM